MDKLLHFFGNYGLVITGGLLSFLWQPFMIICLGLSVFLSVGKEVYDWFKYGKKMGWSKFKSLMFGDLLADGIGIIFGIILFFGVRYGIF